MSTLLFEETISLITFSFAGSYFTTKDFETSRFNYHLFLKCPLRIHLALVTAINLGSLA